MSLQRVIYEKWVIHTRYPYSLIYTSVTILTAKVVRAFPNTKQAVCSWGKRPTHCRCHSVQIKKTLHLTSSTDQLSKLVYGWQATQWHSSNRPSGNIWLYLKSKALFAASVWSILFERSRTISSLEHWHARRIPVVGAHHAWQTRWRIE